ncbi:MAG: hypothetical protein RDV48_14855 [Candidatus Eremiobacteraeota bacterium]|nr:hypothetical protein [Candidatus Eremiobacteraeota bacterium]
MNEIQQPGFNPSISQLEQAGPVGAPQAVQESQRLGMYIDNVLGSEGGTVQQGFRLDAVMSGCLNGYLGLGDRAMEALENPLASAEILNMGKNTAGAPQALKPMAGIQEGRAFETLTSYEAPEVSEVALGLVPGVGAQVASTGNPASVSQILEKSPGEEVAMKDQEKAANVGFETLGKWELDSGSEMAYLESGAPQGLALGNSAPAMTALATPPGEAFDVRPMVSRPVIEGNRAEYSGGWSQIHETLSRFDGTGNNGMIGMTDWLNGQAAPSPAIGLDAPAPAAPTVGMIQSPGSTELMGHHAIMTRELFGFLDLSSYSQSVAMGVNPTTASTALSPGKYISNLVDGYYT